MTEEKAMNIQFSSTHLLLSQSRQQLLLLLFVLVTTRYLTFSSANNSKADGKRSFILLAFRRTLIRRVDNAAREKFALEKVALWQQQKRIQVQFSNTLDSQRVS